MKIEEWENKRDLSRTKYEGALQDITDYNARYMEDMTEVCVRVKLSPYPLYVCNK